VEFETLLGLFINLHMDQSSSVLFSEVDQVCGCSRERTNFEVRAEFLNALNNVMFRVGVGRLTTSLSLQLPTLADSRGQTSANSATGRFIRTLRPLMIRVVV